MSLNLSPSVIVRAIQGTAAVLSAVGEVVKETKVTRNDDGQVQTVTVFSLPLYDRARRQRIRERRADRKADRERDGR